MSNRKRRLYPSLTREFMNHAVNSDRSDSDDSIDSSSSLSCLAEKHNCRSINDGRRHRSSSRHCRSREHSTSESFSGEETSRLVPDRSRTVSCADYLDLVRFDQHWIVTAVCLCVFGGLVLIACRGYILNYAVRLWTEQRYSYSGQKINDRFLELQSRFPAQTARTWSVLKVAVKAMLRDYPLCRQPSVVLAIYGDGARRTSYCLTLEVAEMVSDLVYPRLPASTINCSQYDHLSASTLRLLLDKRLKAALTSSSAVVIEDIANLTGDAIRILHPYCDTNDAPFKPRLIIMTCFCGQAPLDTENMEVDREADECLEALCASKLIAKDITMALISRISSNAINVVAEATDPC
ncbi:unnamed protein product [Soboliphyme baturini]|uniref:LAP1_C domain-containing protein n=1 Tax=Soboliphyme baturini TaxID=241478 RepID=A0A183J7D3_9BILA|nr:unnamed protein product [Soboliphyme baturini]